MPPATEPNAMFIPLETALVLAAITVLFAFVVVLASD